MEEKIDILEVLARGKTMGIDDPREELIRYAEGLNRRISTFKASELPEYQRALDALNVYEAAVIRRLIEIQKGGYKL